MEALVLIGMISAFIVISLKRIETEEKNKVEKK